ncbi:MAG TPA: DUF2589 domain-containing protein [Thermoanaerobaculia bacterium]|nr:DUF2589 domain-containing protein [Thermoanaerobaculia bacterium]
MPIDTTPSTVATNALQAIPFKALIGGPLQACVEAQAQAANTTWNFIKEVGLNPKDQYGNRSATTVVFQYQKGGEMVNLVVPLLAIVPIPFLAVDDVSIDFKANISAASSSVAVQSESTTAGGSVGGSFGGGWGPFGVHANFNANYSSKKDSRASQDSKYSVEYTMDVRVHAGQADMPAGLARVLNLLESAISEGNPQGSLEASPRFGYLDAAQPQAKQEILIVVKDSGGLLLRDQPVKLALTTDGNAFQGQVTRGQSESPWKNGAITVKTDAKGQAGILIGISGTATPPPSATVKVEATVKSGGKEQTHEENLLLQIANAASTPPAPSLTGPSELKVQKNIDRELQIKAMSSAGQPVQQELTFKIDTDGTKFDVQGKHGTVVEAWSSTSGTIKVKTATDGIATIGVKLTSDQTTAKKFTVSATLENKLFSKEVQIKLES